MYGAKHLAHLSQFSVCFLSLSPSFRPKGLPLCEAVLLFDDSDGLPILIVLPHEGRIQVFFGAIFAGLLLCLGKDSSINYDFVTIGKRAMIIAVSTVKLHFDIPVLSRTACALPLTAPILLWHCCLLYFRSLK